MCMEQVSKHCSDANEACLKDATKTCKGDYDAGISWGVSAHSPGRLDPRRRVNPFRDAPGRNSEGGGGNTPPVVPPLVLYMAWSRG